MALPEFGTPPPGVLGTLNPYTLSIADDQVAQLTDLLRTVPVFTASYFNTHTDPTNQNHTLGMSLEWLTNATSTWLNNFSWRKHENRLNAVPNFVTTVTTAPPTNSSNTNSSSAANAQGAQQGGQYKVHFAALFSRRKDATPLLFLHGWPGAWFEFLPVMERLGEKYTPETLPFHVVVPSLPGFGISTLGEGEMTFAEAAGVVDGLMGTLGMGGGYVVQGGDVGSMAAMVLGKGMEGCRAVHVNMVVVNPASMGEVAGLEVTEEEAVRLARMREFVRSGRAYQVVQGERPATVGFAVMASPVAMLAWIGEKILEWSDSRSPIPLGEVLTLVSFYWFTKSFGTSIWPYRATQLGLGGGLQAVPSIGNKPMGYSGFPFELFPIPKSWAEKLFPGMVFYTSHETGGHFAALEQPDVFLKDVEEFVTLVKKDLNASSSS